MAAKGIRIKITSIYVDDQGKALDFYTEKLGFIKQLDVPTVEYRWLTVSSPADPDGVQVLLFVGLHVEAELHCVPQPNNISAAGPIPWDGHVEV